MTAPALRGRPCNVIDDVPADDRLYGAEIAELTGISSARLVYRSSIKDGFPRAKRIGVGSFCWSRREVVAWLAANGRPRAPGALKFSAT